MINPIKTLKDYFMDEKSFSMRMLRIAVVTGIVIVFLDILIPVVFKIIVLSKAVGITGQGVDANQIFKAVPDNVYTYMNFLIATLAGLYGYRRQTDASVEKTKISHSNKEENK